MPVQVDDAVASPDANSYVSVDEATAYFANRLNAAAWDGEPSADRKAAALVTATARLDVERYVGTRTTDEQALKWPRRNAYDEDQSLLDDMTIPRAVKVATYEMANFLLSKGTTDAFAPSGLEAFKSLKTPDAEIVLNTDRGPADIGGLPPIVRMALGTLLITYDDRTYDDAPGRFRVVRA